MKDERIEQAKNKIRSEMAVILYLGIVVSFVVKTLVFKMNLQQCITEYIILIFFPLYQFIRLHMMKSIYSECKNQQLLKNLLMVIAIIAVLAAFIMKNSINQTGSLGFLMIFLVFFAVIYVIVNKFNQHRGHKYEEEYDDDK